MSRIFSILGIVAMVLFAAPLKAQQPTTGQDKAGMDSTMSAGDQGMTSDTSSMGRQGEGVSRTRASDENTRDQNTTTNTTDQAGNEGGTMPTTGSPLPAVLVAGLLLVGAGLTVRYAVRRS